MHIQPPYQLFVFLVAKEKHSLKIHNEFLAAYLLQQTNLFSNLPINSQLQKKKGNLSQVYRLSTMINLTVQMQPSNH